MVAGFGRIGRVVSHLLKDNGFKTTVIDHNPDRFTQLRAEGFVGFYGNALRPDLLEAAGARHAKLLVVAIDDPEAAITLVRWVHREYPHLKLLSRAVDAEGEHRHLRSGADRAYGETFETALLMGEDVLELVGMSPLDAQAVAEKFRDEAHEQQSRLAKTFQT